MQLRKDNKMLVVKRLEGNEVHVLNEKNEYQRVELDEEVKEEEVKEEEFRGVIARLNTRGVLKVQYEEIEHREEMMPEKICVLNENELCIRDCILNHAAYAACDRSKKDELFEGYCVITDAGRSVSLRENFKSN